MSAMTIRSLDAQHRDALADLLVETVAHGGSVSFMHPLAQDDARAFWEASLAQAASGVRFVLGAFDGETLIGTVTLHCDCPPNQPHRGEIAKMMTAVSHRGRGVGTGLLQEAERIAQQNGRTLLVLDTAVDEGATDFYRKLGYILAGTIPDFALKPHGGLTGTNIFYKYL
jgi:ribosomal protein S18 acetylase RimI-like enzyme